MPPIKSSKLTADDFTRLSHFLHGSTGASRQACRSVLPDSLSFYGKVRVGCDGDTVQARELVRKTDLSQDASYVSVSLTLVIYIFVTHFMYYTRRDKQRCEHEAWGQLLRVALIQLSPQKASTVNLAQGRSFFVAFICRVDASRDRHDLIQYTRNGQIDLVNFNSVHCVVGRVKDRGRWSILDRSEGQCDATFSTRPELV
jgi:hypothetical protein